DDRELEGRGARRHALRARGWRRSPSAGCERREGERAAQARRHQARDAEGASGERAGSGACQAPYTSREVVAMSRKTSRGNAPVDLTCLTFGISRAAYYAQKKRDARGTGAEVIPLRRPPSPRYASSEVVLDAIRRIIAEHP